MRNSCTVFGMPVIVSLSSRQCAGLRNPFSRTTTADHADCVEFNAATSRVRPRRERRRTTAKTLVAVSVAAGTLLAASSAGNAAEIGNVAQADKTVLDEHALLVDQVQWLADKIAKDAHDAAVAREAEARRPKSVVPVIGIVTSLFGPRWGTLHAGVDFANAIGTPITSVTDGTIIEAGPASGFGLWVRVQQDDGTIGVYGHVNDILAAVGQRVRAGDVIATVGNRGQSTGPHLHYEVWAPDGQKIDPLPWLLSRGVSIAPSAEAFS